MRVLLDVCVWSGVGDALQRAGHDVARVTEWDRTASDQDILARGAAEQRVVITLDKDFRVTTQPCRRRRGAVRKVLRRTIQRLPAWVVELQGKPAVDHYSELS